MSSAEAIVEELLARGGTDRSTSETVIEYAVQDLMKGKSPAAAAGRAARRLSGGENMFLGPGVSVIDPARLETALWDRLAERVVKSLRHYAVGKEHYALEGTLHYFNQIKLGELPKPAVRAKLKALVVAKLGRDPFIHDEDAP